MYYQSIDAEDQQYVRVDDDSIALPRSITPAEATLTTGWTDAQYIAEGGPWATR